MDGEQRLIDEIQAALRSLVGVERLMSAGDTLPMAVAHERPDLIMRADIRGRSAIFLIEAKAYGYPRDMRAAADQLARYAALARLEADEVPLVPLVVAPAISPGGRAVLRERGIGYWDRGGSLYLDLPWAHYDIERPPSPGAQRQHRSPYRGRAAQVVHALLVEPARAWHVGELATCAAVSPYTAHQVLTMLERELWVDKEGRGPRAVRRLREPGALLEAWAAAHRLEDYAFRRFHAWAQSPAALAGHVTAALDASGVEYALTLTSGAALVAPFAAEAGRLTVLVPARADLADVIRDVKLRPAEEGENVAFLSTRERSPLLFRQRVHDAWVASDVQLYRDLWAWPRRGREQAAHLRAERLTF